MKEVNYHNSVYYSTLCRKINEFSLNSRKEITMKKEIYCIQALFNTAETVGVYLYYGVHIREM